MGELPRFLDSKTERELKEAFEQKDSVIAGDDSWMQWRLALNRALGDEMIGVLWGGDEAPTVRLSPMDGTFYNRGHKDIPVVHLEDLFSQLADPRAVTSYLKAVMHDDRFRLWRFDEEDSDEE